MLKRFITICLLITAAFTASADVFTVTSNADAGAGTLRQALTFAAANGITVKDYIYFNITDQSEAGRTIIIATQLPNLSSNLVIDGGTQPGNKIGMSDTKIIIKTFRSTVSLTVMEANGIDHVSLLGLYLLDTSSPCISDPDGAEKTAISFNNCSYITLGEAGRGNVINGYKYTSLKFEKSNNIVFAGNTFGLSPYAIENVCSGGISLNKCYNIDIGTQQAGNVFFSGLSINMDGSSNLTNVINVINNNFAVAADGITTLHAADGNYIRILTSITNSNDSYGKVLLTIEGNLVSHFGQFGGMIFTQLAGNIIIKHNWFGTDRNSTLPLNLRRAHPGEGNAIWLENITADVVIGDNDPVLGNKFAYSTQGIAATNVKNLLLKRNSFKCISYKEYYTDKEIPQIAVTSNTTQYIAGTTEPLALVDLFSSDDCTNCSPETYIGSTNADATGNWKYDFPVHYTSSILANAHLGKQSSNFTKPEINLANLHVTDFDCGNSGKVTGIIVKNTNKLKWVNEHGDVVSTELELKNVNPGRYKLIIGEYCTTESEFVTINDRKPQIIDISKQIQSPSCNSNNGSIKNIIAYTIDNQTITYKWLKNNSEEVGNTPNLINVGPGSYTLIAKTPSGCEKTYGPINLSLTNGPNINASLLAKTPSSCTIANGSIHGVTATGTNVKYSWKNEQNVGVGTSADLDNQPAGKYTLTVTDDSNCGPVTSSPIEILEVNGITIDDAGRLISKATCQYDNGGIINIQVTGATKYTWYNESNIPVSNNLELTGMPTGNYYLIAANDNGCSKQTVVYTITRQAPINYGGLTKILKNATCDENNGSIEVIFQNPPPVLPDSYKWVNTTTGQVVNTPTPILNGIDAGKYDIYGITNGCEQYLINYSIGRDPRLTVVTNNVHKNDDHCASGTGSIKGIQATGATPLSFIWTDDNGINRGASVDLLNITAGTYHLKITDGANCEQGFVYTIYDQSDNIAPPIVNDVKLCSPGSALVSVSNADSKYGYRLYEDNNSATPIDEQQNGSFKVNVKANHSYYISQYLGNCESTRQEVNVLISGISGADIANTFTPNGDGINDYWKITGMQSYTNGTVKVFNRDGKMVYQSKGYAVPFDGTLNSKPLPAGVYYYIIDLKSCNLISGNLTILR